MRAIASGKSMNNRLNCISDIPLSSSHQWRQLKQRADLEMTGKKMEATAYCVCWVNIDTGPGINPL
jgi:hypothetical protein